MREAYNSYYSAKKPVDHITDHLPFRSTWKQWTGERRRARFFERKGAEKVIFSGNCPYRFVWDHQAAGSIPVTRTKILTESRVYSPPSVIFYADLSALPPLLKKPHFYDHIIKSGLKIPFSLFTAVQNLKSQTSNRHRFPCGGCLNNYLTVRPDLSRSFSAAISSFFCLIISASFSSHSSLVSA